MLRNPPPFFDTREDDACQTGAVWPNVKSWVTLEHLPGNEMGLMPIRPQIGPPRFVSEGCNKLADPIELHPLSFQASLCPVIAPRGGNQMLQLSEARE